MTFLLKPLPSYLQLQTFDTNKGRYYDTPEGKLPSVTTVLNAYQNKEYLVRWRKRIGAEEAHRITEQAQRRGNAIHKMAELYLSNDKTWKDGASIINVESFLQIKPWLDANIECVYGCEIPLYSRTLHIAGTTDSVVTWKGKNAILDFKTSKRPVSDTSDKLRFYKLQATIYAMLILERFNLNCEHSHIIIIQDHELPKLVSFRNTGFRLIAQELIENVILPGQKGD